MSVAIIPDFVKYQIEWLRSHNDLEFEPVIEDAIVEMLQDTGKSFIDERAAETAQNTSSCAHENDVISRKAAIDLFPNDALEWDTKGGYIAPHLARRMIEELPSAQPEITDEQAIEHLQSTGWMQNHDREIYESGLRVQLADDSGSYDSLIPCEDTISRQTAIDALDEQIGQCNKALGSFDISPKDEYAIKVERASLKAYRELLENLPSAQPEQRWIPVTERLPENDNEVLITVWDAEDDYVEVYKGFYQGHEWWTQWCHGCSKIKDEPCGENIVIAWMPLPKPYRGGEKE